MIEKKLKMGNSRLGVHMKDKIDVIINGGLKPKLSYYFNPLLLRITVIIVLIFLVLALENIF